MWNCYSMYMYVYCLFEKLNYHKSHLEDGFMKVLAGQLNAFENASLFCKVPITLSQKINKHDING